MKFPRAKLDELTQLQESIILNAMSGMKKKSSYSFLKGSMADSMYFRYLFFIGIFICSLAPVAAEKNEWIYAGQKSIPKWSSSKLLHNAQADISFEQNVQSPEGEGALKIEIKSPATNGKKESIQIYPLRNGITAGDHSITVLMKASTNLSEQLQFVFTEVAGSGFAKPATIDCSASWNYYTVPFSARPGFENKKLRMPGIYCGLLPKGTILWIASIRLDDDATGRSTKMNNAQHPLDENADAAPASVAPCGDPRNLIIPSPRQMELHGGTADISPWGSIEGDANAMNMFLSEIEQITKASNTITERKTENGDPLFFCWKKKSASAVTNPPSFEKRPGAYGCIITADGCAVRAFDKQGLYNGLQSILTLVENSCGKEISCLSISDYPAIQNRGLHIILRVSVGFLKEFIRRAARCKYTEIYLAPSANVELIHTPGVFLPIVKQSEIRELAALAKGYNIQLIPEVKCLSGFNFNPAIEGAVLEKNISALLEPPSPNAPNWVKKERKEKRIKLTFKMENEAVYKLIFSVLDEFYDMFAQPAKMHAGLDEGWDFGGSGYDKPNDVLLANHIKRLHEYFKKKGNVMCIWGDQLLNQANYVDSEGNLIRYNLHGGAPFNTAGALDLIPTNIQICSWHYSPQKTYPPVFDVKKTGFPTYGVSWYAPGNIIPLANDVLSCNADGLIGSTWSIHMPRKTDLSGTADKDSGLKNPYQEYEVITRTAEAAWNPYAAEKNSALYDGYELMKKYFWVFVPDDKRTEPHD